MNRKNFIRNTLLAIASTLVPKLLRPMDVEGDMWSGKKTRLPEEIRFSGYINEQPPEWAKHYEVVKTKTVSTWISNRNYAYNK